MTLPKEIKRFHTPPKKKHYQVLEQHVPPNRSGSGLRQTAPGFAVEPPLQAWHTRIIFGEKKVRFWLARTRVVTRVVVSFQPLFVQSVAIFNSFDSKTNAVDRKFHGESNAANLET